MAQIKCPYVNGIEATTYCPNGYKLVICSAVNCSNLGEEIDPEAGRLGGEVMLRNCETQGKIDSHSFGSILFAGGKKIISGVAEMSKFEKDVEIEAFEQRMRDARKQSCLNL